MVVAKPTDDELRAKIRELVPNIDIETTGVKAFVKLLSNEFDNVNLKPRKDFIKQVLAEAINEANASSESESEEDDDDDEEEEEKQSSTPKRKVGGNGLTQQKQVSTKLAAFLGGGPTMARTAIVQQLWEYIRKHELQNPANKREILLDAPMQAVFGCSQFTIFTMNKYISAHVEPFKPVDLTPRKRKKRPSKKKTPTKRKKGTQPPYRLSDSLQAVVGADILPRPQVVSRIWVYIKEHDLQNPNDKREILCDDALQAIFGQKKRISMFKMNCHIGDHLLEKLEKSAYQHEDESSEGDESD